MQDIYGIYSMLAGTTIRYLNAKSRVAYLAFGGGLGIGYPTQKGGERGDKRRRGSEGNFTFTLKYDGAYMHSIVN